MQSQPWPASRSAGRVPPKGGDTEHLCAEVFACLARSDQRQWARVYLNGLLLGGGRKSLRRISAELSEKNCEQSLQQFIGQSPWDHLEVLRSLALRLTSEFDAEALTVHEVAFAKNGTASAGVERQYVSRLGRVINCQMGLAISLTAGDTCTPVYWRLMLPSTWNDDEERRRRARVPEHERSLPAWQYVMEALDELIGGWGLPVPPIVLESRRVGEAERLLAELNDRKVGYAVAIHPTQPLRLVSRRTADASQAVLAPPLPAHECHRTADTRHTVAWTDPHGRTMRSHFSLLPVRLPDGGPAGRGGPPTPLQLIAEAPLGRPESRSFWLTNLVHRPLDGLVQIVKSHNRVARFLDGPVREVGLYDFEGRSYRGWHHHVTIVSVALAHLAANSLSELPVL